MKTTRPLDPLNAASELAFYVDHLKTVLLPFWLKRAPDVEHGGYFTCFDNTGRSRSSEDKFTWSQGRLVWVWARLAGMSIFSTEERSRFLDLARSGAEFLMQHCVLPNGNCTFLMTRDGRPKPAAPGLPLDSSIYADCFVILGLAHYAAASGSRSALDFAVQLYASVTRRIASGDLRSEPYPIPAGYKPHGIPMIMLNTTQELAAGLQAMGMAEEAATARRAGDGYLHDVLAFVAPDGVLHEYLTEDGAFDFDTLLGRHANPGHAIEDAWFMLHQVRGPEAQQAVTRIEQVIERAFAIGWDGEHGGLLHFADQAGGQPRGSVAGMEDVKVVQQVTGGWGDKLWWVHSEALYTTLLAYHLTGKRSYLKLFRQTHDYTFRTFPNPDREIGEWVQIRDRQGRPQQKVVALPVKDPYHIVRNVILIIELLQERSK